MTPRHVTATNPEADMLLAFSMCFGREANGRDCANVSNELNVTFQGVLFLTHGRDHMDPTNGTPFTVISSKIGFSSQSSKAS
jgi:hypothetical protein